MREGEASSTSRGPLAQEAVQAGRSLQRAAVLFAGYCRHISSPGMVFFLRTLPQRATSVLCEKALDVPAVVHRLTQAAAYRP